MCLFQPPEQGEQAPFTGEIYLFPAFTETLEGQRALLAVAACQITLIQSNRYALAGYFGAALTIGPWETTTVYIFMSVPFAAC